jgi:hypothetical protein
MLGGAWCGAGQGGGAGAQLTSLLARGCAWTFDAVFGYIQLVAYVLVLSLR